MPAPSLFRFFQAYSDPKFGPEHQGIHTVLDQFNLIAFLLYDPEYHTAFHEKLTSDFDVLDYETGEKLLLIVPITTLSHFEGTVGRRLRRQGLEAVTTDFTGSLSIRSREPSLSSWLTATFLFVEPEQLPAIIVCQSLESDRFLTVPTNKNEFRQQLRRLGYVASRLGSSQTDSDVLDTINRDTEVGRSSLRRVDGTLGESVADVLTNATALILLQGTEWDPVGHHIARRTAEKVTLEIKNLLDSARVEAANETDPDEAASRLAELAGRYGLALAHLDDDRIQWRGSSAWAASGEMLREDVSDHATRVDKPLFLEDSIDLIRDTLEAESWRSIVTASALEKTFASPGQGLLIDPDWALFVMGIGRAFEWEVNLSIVHWAREILGIDLPVFFNRYQPGREATTTPDWDGAKPVDFNKVDNQNWRPPTLGQSEVGVHHLAKTIGKNRLNSQKWSLLSPRWTDIRRSRNVAAHSGLVEYFEAMKVRDAFQHLVHEGIFGWLGEMKWRYSGEPTQRGA